MTANQNAANANNIKSREVETDRARQKEESRHNRHTERETERSNRANERIKQTDTAVRGIIGLPNAAMRAAELGSMMASINDTKWYSANKQLLDDVASVSFNAPVGNPIDLQNYSPFYDAQSKMGAAPGWMNIKFTPTLPIDGESSVPGQSAAVVSAMQGIYSFVRHTNSGSRNYDMSDLMTYIMACDSLYLAQGYLAKLYSLAMDANSHSRYVPFAGFVTYSGRQTTNWYSYIVANSANYRARLNAFTIRLNSLWVPKMYLFERHYWLATSIFKDSEVKKSQIYNFVPEKIWTWSSSDPMRAQSATNNRSTLILTNFSLIASLDDVFDMLNTVLDNMLNDEDIGLMSGDILKAYGESGCYGLPLIGDEFHIKEIYSPEVLNQITNAKIVGEIYGGPRTGNGEFQVITSSDDGSLLYEYGTITSSGATVIGNQLACASKIDRQYTWNPTDSVPTYKSAPIHQNILVNFVDDNTTPEQVAVATRLIAERAVGVGNKADYIACCCTEVITGCIVVCRDNFSSGINNINSYVGYPFALSVVHATQREVLQQNSIRKYNAFIASQLSHSFDWAPSMTLMLYLGEENADDTEPLVNIDLSNYTHMSLSTLNSIHYACAMSLFGVSENSGKRGRK